MSHDGLSQEDSQQAWENAKVYSSGTANGTWGKLQELPPLRPVAPEMPTTLIPEVFRPWVCDVCERAQVPFDFVIAPALVALGSLIGRSVRIYPKQKDNWLVVPNLWGAIIGRPGLMKTPALNAALHPLSALSVRAQEQFKQEQIAADANKTIIQAQIEVAKTDVKTALKSKSSDDLDRAKNDIVQLSTDLEQAEISERRYIVNDATVEKLGEILKHNPRGVLLHRDELVGFARGLDKPGRETDRAFFLESWNGIGEFTYDRIGRGTLHIPALTVSIIGGMTPGKLSKYISGATEGGFEDDGLLQRFQLLVWPELNKEWVNVDRAPDASAFNTVADIFRRIDDIEPDAVGAQEGEIPALRFTLEAQELFNEWHAELEHRIRSGAENAQSFESHLAKYRSLMPSLALIFHLAESVHAGAVGPVTCEAAQLAARWCEYLECHARKVYAAELEPDTAAAHRLAAKIKQGVIHDGITMREIYRANWSGLPDVETVESGLSVLERNGWARVERQGSGGQSTAIVRLHPELVIASQ